MRLYRCASALIASVIVMSFACGKQSARVAPTFTPSPPQPLAAGETPGSTPSQPVVAASCLRGLSSYRFNGAFSLQLPATPTASAGAGADEIIAGSLANLLSHVTFKGSAQAPDRLEATLNFATNGSQPLQIVEQGRQAYSRFGDQPWQPGNQVSALGNIAELDPESFCERTLVYLDASRVTPSHEKVNGVQSLRYDFSGAQLPRIFGGQRSARVAAPATPAASTARSSQLSIWVAENGHYPVRVQLNNSTAGATAGLQVDVTDINGKDIQITLPR